ncbi:hypothetical protein SBRCBS47491_008869 [Sporothrix bragantina]|uniref:Methyltransferase n=1 Tax=Sporothrix bragantina TaxID=671064 RepID=A0ABP0CQ64_9PEZI
MAIASDIPRGPVHASLLFYEAPPDGSAPYDYVGTPPVGETQQNFSQTSQTVHILDIRGREDSFCLKVDGFQTVSVSNVDSHDNVDFLSDDSIRKTYYPQVQHLLLDQIPGATKVTLFDHTIRRSSPDAARGPVTAVHADQTARSGPWRVHRHDPDDADALLTKRVRIINVWRPLNGPVRGHPLALASLTSVASDDVVPVEHRYPDRIGETAAIRYNSGQQFYYWSGMNNDEWLLIQCYDSATAEDDRVSGVPHAAFVDERTDPAARYRESIEVRAIVYGG